MVPQVGKIYRYIGTNSEDPIRTGDLVTVIKVKNRRIRRWTQSDVTVLLNGKLESFEFPAIQTHPESWTSLFEEVG